MLMFRDRRDLVDKFLPKQSICAEIGIDEGVFSKYIAEQSDPTMFHMIDAWAPLGTLGSRAMTPERGISKITRVNEHFTPMIVKRRVMIHRGHALDVLPLFPDQYFDWVYIDAGHDFDEVSEELVICKSKVRKGGMIAGHDIYFDDDDVGRIQRSFPSVKNAVERFCAEWKWEIVARTAIQPWSHPDPAGRNSPSYVLQEIGR